ncbi:MAG: hypothetical protein JHC95_12955 [Solirubrobacteraceae bacterium]|nr:hypothetical protein [Solirubrobacteraceae bacterium]
MHGATGTFIRLRAVVIAAAAAVAACCVVAAPAQAVNIDGLSLSAVDAQAGARTNVSLSASMSGGDTNGLQIDFPPGLLADVSAPTVCTTTSFNANTCAASSKIGDVSAGIMVELLSLGLLPGTADGSIYRMAPVNPGEVVRMGIFLHPAELLGVQAADLFVTAVVTLRDGTNGAADQGGLRATIATMPTSARVAHGGGIGGLIFPTGSTVTFNLTGMDMTLYGTVNGKPFINTPTTCQTQKASASLLSTVGSLVDTLLTGGSGNSGFTTTACDALPFAPTTAISSASASMDTASAVTVDVNVSDPVPASGRVKAQAKKVVMTLPAGVEFNPPGASPITTCTSAQFNVSSNAAETCANTSIIGTANITSPLLATLGGGGTLTGNVYFGDLGASSSEITRLFVSVSLAGVRVKLVGDLAINDTNGQITATFDNIPQTPFTNFKMTFNGGAHPMLRSPRSCASHAMASTMTAYGDGTPSVATPSSNLSITGDCHSATRFAPSISQTMSNASAGAGTNATIVMTRPQGDARFTKADVAMPPGLVGKLTSVTPCATATAAAGNCTSAAQIGVVETASGDSSSDQATLNGQLYLTDAPAGAVAGLSMKVPAIVGPVNLGNVIVPMKIVMDGTDYSLRIVADSIPTRLQGVPLLLRQIKLTIDRTAGNTAVPFMINSSSCTAKTIVAKLTPDQGSDSSPTTAYQPTNCNALGFAPAVSLTPTSTTADTATAMTLGVTIPSSQSAVKDITLNLPQGVELNPFSATALSYCTAAQFARTVLDPDTCPVASRLGTVSITTPAVGTLTGYAYFGEPTNATDILQLYITAAGGNVRLKFTGDVNLDPNTGRVVTRLTNLPPIQFTAMTLAFNGGTTAPLRTPHACGAAGTTSSLVPHSATATKTPTASFTVTNTNCDAKRFTPTISTTVGATGAGASTTLAMSVTRPNGDARISKVKVAMPPGLLGNLTSVTQCPLATAAAGNCTAASEVGTLSTQSGDSGSTVNLSGKAYLTAPPDGAIAGLALVENAVVGPVNLGKAVIQLKIVMRPDDSGLDIEGDVPTYLKGVPLLVRQISMQVNRAGFLTNRAVCDATAIKTTLGSDQGSSSSVDTAYQATGCASLTFTPTLAVSASPAASDAAAAMTLAVNMPSSGQKQIKDVTVQLPAGVEINPGAGEGLVGCTAAQFGTANLEPANCPAASKIGTSSVTSALVGTLGGNVYFGDPPAGKLMRMFVVAENSSDDGVRIKLIGDVTVDPANGQITTTFSNLPQTPFSQFKLELQGGSRAVLSTPRSCGAFAAGSSLTPYGGGTGASPSANLSLTDDCHDPNRFRPAVDLANVPSQAGADTTLTTTISRPDGDARLSRVAVSMPDGLLGRIEAVPHCGVAAARSGNCPQSSRVGSASTVSGSGGSTITLPGDVYLTDGYDGAIAGLAVMVTAKAGPIDLGRPVVMMKIVVRPNATGIDIASEDLPTRLQGVPLTLRSIALKIDRDGFMFNGTSCGSAPASASLTSDLGATAGASAALATTGCSNLPFAPTMQVDFSGDLTKNSKPGIEARLKVPLGHGNVKKVALTMPVGIGADIAALSNTCPRETYDANACPAKATIGSAKAISPALPGVLSGPVTLVKKAGSALPDLGVRLNGLVSVSLMGNIQLGAGNRLIATFEGIPDVPLSQFDLSLSGGASGALQLSSALCDAPTMTTVVTSHTGAVRTNQTTPPSADCGDDASAKKPSATVKLAGLKSGKPTLKVTATGGATALRSVVVTLPKGLTVDRKAAPKKTGLSAKNPKGKTLKLTKKTVAWKASAFTLKLPSTGARTATMTLRRGVLKAKAGKLRKSKTVNIKVKLTPVSGAPRTQSLRVRVAAR